MNASRTPAIRLLRATTMIIFASFLLAAGQATALAQGDPRLMAVQYFDDILGSASVESGPDSVFFSPDTRLHTPEGVFRGREGTGDFGARLENSFSDLNFVTHKTESVGNYSVIEFTMTGIHTGAYHGAEPQCSGIVVPGMAVLQADSTGITEQWVSYDSQTVLDQIYVFGLFNPDGRPGCGDSWPVVPSDAPVCLAANECQTPF